MPPVSNERVATWIARCSSSPWLYLGLVGTALLVAPFTAYAPDVVGYHLPWARATAGYRPWAIYQQFPDFGYPPVILWLITLVQAFRRITGTTDDGSAAILLLKLPSLIALTAAIATLRRLAAPLFGRTVSAAGGVLFATCGALWLNAVVWGQWDAILALEMTVAVVAGVQGAVTLCGVAVGLAIATKVQSVVIGPVLATLVFRRFGLPACLRVALVASAIWVVIATPFFLAGSGRPLLRTYAGAVDHYPSLSISAYNGWGIVQIVDHAQATRNGPIPTDYHQPDDARILYHLTARQLGLLLLAAYNVFLVIAVARRPEPYLGLFAAAMACLAFYQLPTQMHERYGLPACGLLAVIAMRGAWPWFAVLTITMSLNQVDVLIYPGWQPVRAVAVSTVNVLTLTVATLALARQAFAPPADAASVVAVLNGNVPEAIDPRGE